MQLERNGKKEDETKVTVNLCKLKSSSNPNLVVKVLLDIILNTLKFPADCPFKKASKSNEFVAGSTKNFL